MTGNYDFSIKKERLDFCREVAGEGIVLLKNEDNILPLKGGKLALFGAAQLGAQVANEGVKVDIENSVGVAEAIVKSGLIIDEPLYDRYCEWRRTLVRRAYGEWRNMHVIPEMEITESDARNAKERGAETAVIVISRASYENGDMNIEVGDYILSAVEKEMIKNVCSVFEDVVLLLQIGCGMDLGFLDDFNIKGILYLNHLGVNGALGMADILCGSVNPSGKLTVSLSKHYEDYPSSPNFGQHGGGLLQDYKEDIYVGYRYFETFENADKNLVFPFGFGLSYTSFSFENETFSEKDGVVTVTVDVKNTGKTAGKQVAELYYSCPQQGAALSGPVKQLCAFEKTRLLAPGESETLCLRVTIDSLASYDDTGVLGVPSAFVMERGTHRFLLGTDSRSVHPVGEHIEPENRIIERCHEIKTSLSERLTRSGKYERLPRPAPDQVFYHGISAIGDTVLPVAACYNKNIDNFSGCKAGEEFSFRLLPGTGGGYRVAFAGDEPLAAPVDECFDIYIDGVLIKELNLSENRAELKLPLERCVMTLVAKKDAIPVDRLIFSKIDSKTVIKPTGVTVVDAAKVYECDFKVTVKNYDDGFGCGGAYITDFEFAGKFATFKLEVEEGGTYALSFKYACCGEDRPTNSVITVLASNIVKPLGGSILKKTYNEGQKRVFIKSDEYRVSLPSGTVYLKLAAESVPFPDISEIYFEKIAGEASESDIDLENIRERNLAYKGIPKSKLIDDPAKYPKIGVQFEDVYRDPSLMREFLEQMSNRELATIVSGTTNNLTPGGDVGCNSPVFERGVPAAQTADGPCGLRQHNELPIAMPVGMVLAASFNKELFEQYGHCLAHECLFYKVDYLLGPSINIFRNPAGGRNCSYFSEDPYLCGIAAAHFIKGLQDDGIAAVLKHYAANNTEFERLKSNSRVSGRALREIYMKGFEIACRSNPPWAIMSSYNHVNDVKVCEDYTLITEIPREEWHWDGVFFTDWWNDSNHVRELMAGHDLKMSTGDVEGVTKALDDGTLTREQVYICAERIIKMLFKLGRIKRNLETGKKGAEIQ